MLDWLRDESDASGVAVVLTATAGCPREVAEPPVVKFLPKPFGLTTLRESVAAAVARNGRKAPFNPYRSGAGSELFIG